MRNVIILGAGRSGTSLCAGLLSTAGYHMGADPMSASPANPYGYFEDREIESLNEKILLPQMALWRRMPKIRGWTGTAPGPRQMWLARVPLDPRLDRTRGVEREIERHTNRRPYCYKDPRFSYTLPAWRPYLGDAAFLCVFRDPRVAVGSTMKLLRTERYLADLSLTAADVAETWRLIYLHILARHRRRGQWLFLHYDQLFEEDALKRLEDFIEVDVRRNFSDHTLARSEPEGEMSEANRALYGALCELAHHRVYA